MTELEIAIRALEAADAFVTQLEAVHNDKRYEGVWISYQVHHGQYKGPFYTDELARLKEALSEIKRKQLLKV